MLSLSGFHCSLTTKLRTGDAKVVKASILSSHMVTMIRAALVGVALLSPAAALSAERPTTSVQAEYLMTLYVTFDPHVIDDTMRAVGHPDGTVDGPRIKGKIVQPSGDWLRTMANGLNRLDVRLTIQTDDDQIIYVSYNGIFQCDKDTFDRYLKGATLNAGDCYFVTAPTFETKSERYAWLNGVQAIGKMIEVTRASGGHLIYDIFAIK
jgi:Protein of unknown function (DUF3237)